MATLERIFLGSVRAAENFVRRTSIENNGYSARWDGWNLQTFVPDPRAFTNTRGSFDRATGQWGFTYTFTPNDKGHWIVKAPKAAK